MKIYLFTPLLALLILGCQKQEQNQNTQTLNSEEAPPVSVASPETSVVSLDDILEAQSDDTKARYPYRRPKETLTFFGIQPGMTVVEALPGGGWYSKILQTYLSSEGKLVGVDYDYDMWPNFNFVDQSFLDKRKLWAQEWTEKAKAWSSGPAASVEAYTFANLPEGVSADAVLFVRALHNLNRFEDKGGYLTKALQASHRILKPGGIVGVVQHQAPEDKADEWADGSRGYLKKSQVISQFEKAGFTLVSSSDINENAKDQPGEEDIVWRLPPSLSTSKDNDELKQQYQAIGESSRMTLLFKKS